MLIILYLNKKELYIDTGYLLLHGTTNPSLNGQRVCTSTLSLSKIKQSHSDVPKFSVVFCLLDQEILRAIGKVSRSHNFSQRHNCFFLKIKEISWPKILS